MSFWEQILEQRIDLLENTAARVKALCPRDSPPLYSLEAARLRCGELSPYEFVSFTQRWLGSLAVWRTRLSYAPRADSVGKAVAKLGLSHVVRTYKADTCQVPEKRANRTRAGHRWLPRLRAEGSALGPLLS